MEVIFLTPWWKLTRSKALLVTIVKHGVEDKEDENIQSFV